MDDRKMQKQWDRVQRRAQDAWQHAQDQAQEALDQAQSLWAQARSSVGEAASQASHVSARDMMDRTSHAMSDAAEAARPYLRRVGDRLQDARREAGPYLEHLRDEVSPYLDALRERAGRLTHAASGRLDDLKDRAQDAWSDLRPMVSRERTRHTEMSMAPLLGLIGGGAGLLYLFNREKGADRRGALCERSAQWLRKAENSIDALGTQIGDQVHAAMSDVKDRAAGQGHDLRSEAECMTDRIKDRLGRIVDRIDDMTVELAPTGRVTLSGPMCRRDVDRALAAVSSIPGVTSIENRLSLIESDPDEVRPWANATRVMAGTGGAGLVLAGAKRGGLGGLMMTAVGAGLIARAALDRPMEELLDLAAGKAKDMAHKAEHEWTELKTAAKRYEPVNNVQS